MSLDEFGFIIGNIPDYVSDVISRDRMFVAVDMSEIGKWQPIIEAAEVAVRTQEEAVSKAAQVLEAQRLMLDRRRRELSQLIASMNEQSVSEPEDMAKEEPARRPKVAPPAVKVAAPQQKTHDSKQTQKKVTKTVRASVAGQKQAVESVESVVSSDIDRALNSL